MRYHAPCGLPGGVGQVNGLLMADSLIRPVAVLAIIVGMAAGCTHERVPGEPTSPPEATSSEPLSPPPAAVCNPTQVKVLSSALGRQKLVGVVSKLPGSVAEALLDEPVRVSVTDDLGRPVSHADVEALESLLIEEALLTSLRPSPGVGHTDAFLSGIKPAPTGRVVAYTSVQPLTARVVVVCGPRQTRVMAIAGWDRPETAVLDCEHPVLENAPPLSRAVLNKYCERDPGAPG